MKPITRPVALPPLVRGQLLDAPEGCTPGDLITVDGMPTPEPDARLSSSKKSPWAQAQPVRRRPASQRAASCLTLGHALPLPPFP